MLISEASDIMAEDCPWQTGCRLLLFTLPDLHAGHIVVTRVFEVGIAFGKLIKVRFNLHDTRKYFETQIFILNLKQSQKNGTL